MHSIRILTLAALGVAAWSGSAAARNIVTLYNAGTQSAFYSVTNTSVVVASGCLRRSQRLVVSNSAGLDQARNFQLRAEIRPNSDCSGRTQFDTSFGPPRPIARNTCTLPGGTTPAWQCQ